MSENVRIAILGAGNMGGSLARGFLLKKAVSPDCLTLTALHSGTLDRFKDLGCRLSLSDADAVKGADLIVIAVKPWDVLSVIGEIRDVIDPRRQTIVCLAAGIGSDKIMPDLAGKDGSVPGFLFSIPNTAVEIGEGVTFLSPVTADDAQLELVRSVFAKVGKTVVLPESKLPSGTALASCGIAYAMRYARAAVLGAVELGFKPSEALEIVEQTVIGAMTLMQAHSSHPEEEIDKVTTPGGITIKGLNAMEKAGFTAAVIEGLKASK